MDLMSQMTTCLIGGCHYRCQGGRRVCHHVNVRAVLAGIAEDMEDVSDKYEGVHSDIS